MARDSASNSIVALLKGLKMHGMAQAVAELGDQGAPAQLSFQLPVPWKSVGTQSWRSLWQTSSTGFCFWTWETVSKESFSWSLRISSKESSP